MAESVENKSVDTVADSVVTKSVDTDAATVETESVDTVALAMQHLAAGKRDLLISDPNAAVASMALACELLGNHYGETAFECGEAYYFYGKALLDLVRLETGVIDNLDVDADPEEGGDEVENGQEPSGKTEMDGSVDSKEKEKDEVKAEEKENVKGESKIEEKLNSKDENKANANENVKDETKYEDKENVDDTNVIKETVQDETKEQSEVEKEEEDVSNLQLAWEMLELAKNILVKQAESIKVVNAADDKDAEEKTKLKNDVENRVSDTFQTLGELSIENENYAQAIEDLETCLKRRQEMMEKDSRCIAETHYQLGVAQGFNMEFDEGVKSLEGSIHVLQIRIEKLKSKTESIDPTKARDAYFTREDEIKEVEALIPEIREKIADTKDMKIETFKKLGDKRSMEEGIAANLGLSSGDAEAVNGGSSKLVSTISANLIKKRPATDAVTTDAKKVHIEASVSASGENVATGKGI